MAGMLFAAPQTFTGVITDTMCGANHAAMHVTPLDKCVRECVRMNPAKFKYALYDGTNVYFLSDQKAPEAFAAAKVKVTGTLDAKTKTINVQTIESLEASRCALSGRTRGVIGNQPQAGSLGRVRQTAADGRGSGLASPATSDPRQRTRSSARLRQERPSPTSVSV